MRIEEIVMMLPAAALASTTYNPKSFILEHASFSLHEINTFLGDV